MALLPFGDFVTRIRNKFALRTVNVEAMGEHVISEYESMDVGSEGVRVLETYDPLRIDSLILSADSENVIITIYQFDKDGGGETIGDLFSGGGSRMPFRIKSIVEENSSFWEINKYEDGKYKISLRKGLDLAKGARIEVRLDGSGSAKASVRLRGVVFGD